jgi:hypothetical protein
MNYDMYRGRPVVPRGQQDLPPELQYGPATPEIIKAIGEKFRISPRKIEHIIQGQTGGLGRMVVEGLDLAAEKAGLVNPPPVPTRTASDLPLLRGFTVREPIGSASESVDKFYRMWSAATAAHAGLPVSAKAGNEVDKYVRTHPEIYLYEPLNEVAQTFSEIRQAEATIRSSRDYTPEKKRQELRKLDEAMTKVAQDVVGDLQSRKLGAN